MSTPAVSVVVIGRNEGARLVRCLESVKEIKQPPGGIELIYVDSASTDGSPINANAAGAKVIRINPARPCAAVTRNAGWRQASAPIVLFLDGDTEVASEFVVNALPQFEDPSVAVVWGHRRELAPEASIFNRVLDLDWIYRLGVSEFCGGDALFRREVLEETGGYDDALIAGEEPELCQRIRSRGYKIVHIDEPMTRHDLAMTSWPQYWRRALRGGYAYAEVSGRFRNSSLPLWRRESRRNVVHGGLLAAAIALVIIVSALIRSLWPIVVLLVALFALASRTASRVRWKSPSVATCLLYGLHSHLQQIPILIGQMRYWRDRRAGRIAQLIEYKEPQTTPAALKQVSK